MNIEDMHVGGLVGEAGYERRVFGVVSGGFKGHPAKNGGCVHSLEAQSHGAELVLCRASCSSSVYE